MTGNRQHVNHLLRDLQLENFLMCSADQPSLTELPLPAMLLQITK